MIGNDRLCYRCGKIAYEFLLENAHQYARKNQFNVSIAVVDEKTIFDRKDCVYLIHINFIN